ncbi:hypothetical protein VWS80_03115, partial [Xanthomonas citri pv. citri]
MQLAASGFDAFADGTHLIVGGAWCFLRAIAALRRHGWRCLPAGLLYRRDRLRLRRLRRLCFNPQDAKQRHREVARTTAQLPRITASARRAADPSTTQ